jgi:hypothetical protein
MPTSAGPHIVLLLLETAAPKQPDHTLSTKKICIQVHNHRRSFISYTHDISTARYLHVPPSNGAPLNQSTTATHQLLKQSLYLMLP